MGVDSGAGMRGALRAFLLAGLMGFSACGHGAPDIATLTSNSDQVIWEAGQKALGKKDWESARQHFKRIIDAFPQSQYAPSARLALGDTYIQEGGTSNDILAIGGIDALREEAGLRVPDDISVAGFDDIPMAAWARYGLTTYRQPLDAIVATTLQLIAAPATPLADASRHHLLEGELVIRNSTAARGAESIIPPSGYRLAGKDDAGTRI